VPVQLERGGLPLGWKTAPNPKGVPHPAVERLRRGARPSRRPSTSSPPPVGGKNWFRLMRGREPGAGRAHLRPDAHLLPGTGGQGSRPRGGQARGRWLVLPLQCLAPHCCRMHYLGGCRQGRALRCAFRRWECARTRKVLAPVWPRLRGNWKISAPARMWLARAPAPRRRQLTWPGLYG
jgi:hypothetical protein